MFPTWKFVLEGADAMDLIQRVVSNDVSKLVDGQAQYAYFPNETGESLMIY